MRRLALLALASLFGGVALLAYGAAVGQGQVHLVLIFPVFTGTGIVSFAGMILLVLGMFLGFASFSQFSMAAPPEAAPAGGPTATVAPQTAAKKFGGFVFIGPVPIVFGSDVRVARLMLVLAVVVTILLIAFVVLASRT